MTNLAYHDRDFAALPATRPTKSNQPFWRAIADAVRLSRQRVVERRIALYIEQSGGRLTDQMEREISNRLQQRGSFIVG